MIQVNDIKLQFKASMNMAKYHHTVHRDDALGIQVETITKKGTGGLIIGNPKNSYFIDNDKREFEDIDSILKTINEINF